MAPRPAMGPKPQKQPWYKTTAGLTIAAIGTMVLVLVILVSVNNARTENREREALVSSYEDYSDRVRALLQQVTGSASEMAAATQTPPEDLKAAASKWTETFVGGQTQVSALLPPEGATTSHHLFAQSMSLFASAASTFTSAADAEGAAQGQLLAAAASQVQSASTVWDAGVTALDEARDDNDLSPSGLRSPTEAPASGMPTPAAEATVPVESDDDGGGSGGDGGKDDGSKQDDGSGG